MQWDKEEIYKTVLGWREYIWKHIHTIYIYRERERHNIILKNIFQITLNFDNILSIYLCKLHISGSGKGLNNLITVSTKVLIYYQRIIE